MFKVVSNVTVQKHCINNFQVSTFKKGTELVGLFKYSSSLMSPIKWEGTDDKVGVIVGLILLWSITE